MGAPIRSQDEIDLIVNKAQHAIGDLGYSLMESAKRGEDSTNNNDFRDDMFRLLTIRALLKNILNDDGDIKAYYQDSDNEKKLNKILDGLARMALVYSGTSIPLLTGKRIPLYYYPSTASPTVSSGSAVVRFENTDVDSPSEVVDSFDSNSSTLALYVVTVIGSNGGEGTRTSLITVSIRAGSADMSETRTPDVGGITSPLTFDVDMSGNTCQLIAYASTNNWVVRGIRLTY